MKKVGKLQNQINVLKLNANLLNKYLINSNNINKNDYNKIHHILANLQIKFIHYDKIFCKMREKKAKLLIENQIHQEKIRKLKENKIFYEEKLSEKEKELNKKNEYILLLKNRLNEVTNYIKNKEIKRKKYKKDIIKKYKSFNMDNFLENNYILSSRENKVRKEINEIIMKIVNNNEVNDIKNNKIHKENNDKEQEIKNYIIEKYKKQSEYLKARISKFENMIDRMKNIKLIKMNNMQLVTNNIVFNNHNFKNDKCNKEEEIEKHNNDNYYNNNFYENKYNTNRNTILSFPDFGLKENRIFNTKNNTLINKLSNQDSELTKRMNSFYEFSFIMNKKKEDSKCEDCLSGMNEKVLKSNIWGDISRISKTDA